LSGDHYFGIDIVSPVSASSKLDSAEAVARDVIANL
jgi:hypothetical protein